MTTDLVPAAGTAAAGAAAMVRREDSGVIALALLSERDFESRLTALKLGQGRVRRIQKEMMTEDEDYGVIPGTNKPALLKPGAEKICQVYGLVPAFEESLTVGDGITSPHLRIKTKCYLHLGSKEGPIVGEGVGSANSWERKHRYRGALRSCPKCGVDGSIRRSKFDDKGWYCHDKSGGCGEQFKADDPTIVNQQGGQVENPDPYDVENTLFKMAEKRSHVDAVLRTTATSGLFTQDVEEDLGGAAASAARSVGSGSATASGTATTATATGQSSEPGSVNTTVKDITTKKGTNAKGPWTLYTVTFADGRKGTTFHESLAKHAENARASAALVNPTLETTAKGTNLTGFEPIQKAAPAAEVDEPVTGPENILTVRQVDTDSGPRWVIQTDKRQVVTDQEAFAKAAQQARADKIGLIPVFEVVPRQQGGTVNKLTAWTAPEMAGATTEREPGEEG